MSLLAYLNSWTLSMDKAPTNVLYFDFSKIFNSVPPKPFALILDHSGIWGHLLKWITASFQTKHFKYVLAILCLTLA